MSDNPNVLENQKVEESKKVCPFLVMQVTTVKPKMVAGKVVQLPESQLRLNICIKNNCAVFNETINKCGLVK